MLISRSKLMPWSNGAPLAMICRQYTFGRYPLRPQGRWLSLSSQCRFATDSQIKPAAAIKLDPREINSFWTAHCERANEKNNPLARKFNGKSVDNMWMEYKEQTSAGQPYDFEYLLELARRIKKAGGPDAIKRIQHILRDINARDQTATAEKTFVLSCNMLISLFIGQSDLKSARLVFDGMIRAGHTPTSVTVCTVIDGIAKLGTTHNLHSFYNTLKEQQVLPEDSIVYQRLMTAFGERGDVEGCSEYFAKMVDLGLDTKDAYYTMIETYADAGQVDMLMALYQRMKKQRMTPSEGSFSMILGALYNDKRIKEMETVYSDLLASGLRANAGHFSAMNWTPERSLEEMRRTGNPRRTRDFNKFIQFYIRQNDFHKAYKMIKEMEKDGISPDVFSYGILIDCAQKDKDLSMDVAFELYDDMIKSGIQPDVVVYTTLISACGKSDDVNGALRMLEEMDKYHIKPNLYTFNALFTVFSKRTKPAITDLEHVKTLWKKMRSLGIFPDTRTYNVYLSSISRFVSPLKVWRDTSAERMPRLVDQMLFLYRSMQRSHSHLCRPDFLSYSVLINTLVQCGNIRSALLLYSDAKTMSVKLPLWTYNTLLGGLQSANRLNEILPLWQDMKAFGILPNQKTYELVLDACSQLGLVESFTSIRSQRKQDFDRLLEDKNRRMDKRDEKRNNEAQS